MMIHKKIIDYHGRIDNVKLFNKDPTTYIAEAKQKEEARLKAIKEAERAKQLAEENGEEIEESKDAASAAAAAAAAQAEEEEKGPDYIEFADEKMTIFEMFGEYGKETKAEVEEDENSK